MAEKPRRQFQFAAAPTRAIGDSDLSAADLRTLLAISSYDRFGGAGNGNRSGCYASQSRLAKDIGASREQVNRSIKRLRSAGYIDATRSTGRDQRLIYFVVFDPVTKQSQDGVTEQSQSLVTSSSQSAVDGVTVETQGCDETVGSLAAQGVEFHNANKGIQSADADRIYSAKQEVIHRKAEDIDAEANIPQKRKKYSPEGASTRQASQPNLSAKAAMVERDMRSKGIEQWHVEQMYRLCLDAKDFDDPLGNIVAHVHRVEEFALALYVEKFGKEALIELIDGRADDAASRPT